MNYSTLSFVICLWNWKQSDDNHMIQFTIKNNNKQTKRQAKKKLLRLKKKFCVSKLPPAFVLLCAFDFAKFRLSFFFLEIIFFHFFSVLEEFKHVGAQKTCKIPLDFWKYGSWNFSAIFGFGCAWRQRPIEVKKNKKIKKRMPHRFEKFSQALRQSIFFSSLSMYKKWFIIDN